jgi:uncharacterized protein YecT (DUF1311 family)
MIFKAVTTLLVLVASISSIAAATLPPTITECGSQVTQSGMNICFAELWRDTEAKLNVAYVTLIARVEGTSKARLLRKAEHAWIVYRDKHCAFVASAVEGGSAQPMIKAQCLAELTEQRLKALDEQLNCREGDLACVHPSP